MLYRPVAIIGFIGVLIGGWLLIRQIGGILDSVAVPLPKCPLAGISLPRGSVLLSEELDSAGIYTARFENAHPWKDVSSIISERMSAAGLPVNTQVTAGTELLEFPRGDGTGAVLKLVEGQAGSSSAQYELRIEPAATP